ncbi:hypothetical protein [Cruoricaptor ignavus]|uniref:hypothetical protein n=1 Tax=Cruoricaptor ignavus TaxID=1118202 RepID=UPI00116043AE|nr:hypothetical protein [Cruoricaptor ignavus]
MRNSSELLDEYKRLFKEKFGYMPSCVPCTFNQDWAKFTANQQIKTTTMDTSKTFQLRDAHKIYTYEQYDEGAGRSFKIRTYGHQMTEDFARKYLEIGTDEQLKDRKAEFKVLPQAEGKKPEEKNTKTLKEMQKEAAEKGYEESEWKSLKKDELEVYLQSKEIDEEVK